MPAFNFKNNSLFDLERGHKARAYVLSFVITFADSLPSCNRILTSSLTATVSADRITRPSDVKQMA